MSDKDEKKLEQLAKNLFKLKPKPRQDWKKGEGKKKPRTKRGLTKADQPPVIKSGDGVVRLPPHPR